MQIQIREDSSNRSLDTLKRINIKIPNEKLDNIDNITFSFIDISGGINRTVYHSNDCEEGIFLNYGSSVESTMELKFPENGIYNIKIACKETTTTVQSDTFSSLDDSGNLVESVVEYDQQSNKYYESNAIELDVGGVIDTWI